jgi:hypothetical protein
MRKNTARILAAIALALTATLLFLAGPTTDTSNPMAGGLTPAAKPSTTPASATGKSREISPARIPVVASHTPARHTPGKAGIDRKAYERFLENHPFNRRTREAVRSIGPDGNEDEEEEGKDPDRPDLAFEQDFLRTMDPRLGRPTPEVLDAIRKRNIEILDERPDQAVQALPGSSTATAWTERGPNNVGGRVRGLAWDPNDATLKKVWTGGVTGGLWYNNDITNANSSWVAVNQFWNTLSISAIAFDPVNPRNMYVGTGEGFGTGASLGNGIWKSTDAGVTWTQLPSTTTFSYVNDIIVRNENGTGVVYAAVDGGFYQGVWHNAASAGLQRSTNGGQSWTQVLPKIGTQTINYVPSSLAIGKDNRLWVGSKASPYSGTDRGGGRVLLSENGTSWTVSDSVGVANGRGRVLVATAPSNEKYAYSFVENNGKVGALRRTTDGGTSWTNMGSQPDDLDNGIPADDFTRGQGWYDQAMAVDPVDSNVVLIGGIDLFRSRDGGGNWAHISKWSNNANLNTLSCALVHADQHVIRYRPGDSSTVIFGTDGGVYYTNTIGTATTSAVIGARNRNLNITQFYAGAIHPGAGSNFFLAGSQDNGTQRFTSAGLNSTTQATGGDGGDCFIDQTLPNYQITSYVYNVFYRSTNGGTSFGTLLNDQSTGSFINVACYDDQQHILYTFRKAGSSGGSLYAIKNIHTTPVVDSVILPNLTSAVTALRVSQHTVGSTTLYLGTSSGVVMKVEKANTGSPVVTTITGTLPTGSVSCIEVGRNEQELLVTHFNYGINRIWYTTNGGTTWVNKMGNFPNMPVRWALFNPVRRDTEVILATELGIYGTTNFNTGSPTWNPVNNGFANVRTDMLQIRRSDYQVMAATHGRGLYTSNGFSEAIAPVLTSFTPAIGKTGDTILLKGRNLTGATRVTFGAIGANTYSVLTDTTVRAILGSGGNGEAVVVTPGGEAALAGFLFCGTPAISAPAPGACQGDSVQISSSAGTSYTWFRNGTAIPGIDTTASSIQVKQTGTYTVRVREANGCLNTSAGYTITISPPPAKPVITKGTGDTLVSSAATGNQWYFNGEAIVGANAQKLRAANTGSYNVQVNLSGCVSPVSETFAFVPTPVITIDASNSIRYYPNPVRREMTVDFRWNNMTSLSASVYDRQGRIVARFGDIRSGKSIDLSTLASGSYVIRFSDRKGTQVHSSVFLKQ